MLARLAPDVAWEAWDDNSAQQAGVPWLMARHGREGAAAFFDVVGRMRIHRFDVLSMMAGGNQVAVEFEIDATPEGCSRYVDQEIHLWTFNAAGQVTRLRHYADTAKHIASAGL